MLGKVSYGSLIEKRALTAFGEEINLSSCSEREFKSFASVYSVVILE